MGQVLADIHTAFERLEAISLSEMDSVQLLDRMDTKFMLNSGILPELIASLGQDYRCLQVDEGRGTDYRTLYFDTEELLAYREHHNGRTFRSKVRMREYMGTNLCFLEVKRKTGRGGTDKVRMRIPEITEVLNAEQRNFIGEALGKQLDLKPILWNSFKRYTLVNKNIPERLTIDVGLEFLRNGNSVQVKDLCICELKQERVASSSFFFDQMRKRNIRPSGISKYCLGLIKSDTSLKCNTFKPTLLQIQKIQNAA